MPSNDENKDLDKHFMEGLIGDFEALVKNKINWRNALLHVLDVALEISEKNVETYLEMQAESIFDQGFQAGIKAGIESSVAVLESHQMETEMILDGIGCDCEDCRSLCDCVECDDSCKTNLDDDISTVEDLSNETFDEIQKIIRDSEDMDK